MKTRSSYRNDGSHDSEVASDEPASQLNVRSQQSRAAPKLTQQVETHTKVNRESSQAVGLPKNHRHGQGAQAYAQEFLNGRQSLNRNANHADGEKRPQHSSPKRPQQHLDDLFAKPKHRPTSIGRSTPSNAHSQLNQQPHNVAQSQKQTQTRQQLQQQPSYPRNPSHNSSARPPNQGFSLRDGHVRSDRPVNVAAASEILHALQFPECLDDLLYLDPDCVFEFARDVIDGYFFSRDRKDPTVFRHNTHALRDAVLGTLGVFMIPVVRGDERPPSPDNKNVLAGPCDTRIQAKMTPGLTINNSDPKVKQIFTLTTKSHSDLEALRRSGEMAKNLVQMCRVNAGKPIMREPCFTTLEFVATSDTFHYKDPCFLVINGQYAYPQNAIWYPIGHLDGDAQHVKLQIVIDEANRQLAAPNLRKIESMTNNTPMNTIPRSLTTPDSGPKLLTSSKQRFLLEETNTLASKYKTRTLPVNPDQEPMLPVGEGTGRIPDFIDDLSIAKYFCKNGAAFGAIAEMVLIRTEKQDGDAQANGGAQKRKHADVEEERNSEERTETNNPTTKRAKRT